MRVDLSHSGHRPLLARFVLAMFKMRTGVYLGPVAALSYRSDLLNKDLNNYISRGMHGSGGWSKGEAELFSAFVSSLNKCRF